LRKILTCTAFLGLLAHAPAQTRRLSADDLPKFVRVTDPQVSPDGKTVAILVGRANLKDDRWDTELDFVDVTTKQLRVMVHGRPELTWARWSPQGDRVAFLVPDGEKHAQIWVLPVSGGDAFQITHAKTSIRQLTWRPDGKVIAYAAPDEAPEKKDEAKFDDAFEVGNNSYLERAAAMPVHLWTVEVEESGAGSAKRLTSGAWSLPVHAAPSGPPSEIWYTPDGQKIVFVRADSPITGDSTSSRLELLNVASGAMQRLTQSNVEEHGPRLSPDGELVAYSYPRDGKLRNEESIYWAPLQAQSTGSVGRNATGTIDHDIAGAVWLPGNALLVSGPDATKTDLWIQPLQGAPRPVNVGSLSPALVNVGRGGEIVFIATDATHAGELFYMPNPETLPAQLTHLQTALDGVALGKQETIQWKSDEWQIDGVLTYPPGYQVGKKFPLVLLLHGGPTAASLETFTPSAHILAAQGWLVLEPNYRGSNNLGNAFQAAIVNDASAGPGRDIIAGVRAVEAKGIVDETRVAVSGWSYGGQMTAWMIGNYPTVWKTAVAGAPVTELVDQYTLSDNNVERASGYGPSPFVGDNMKAYAAESPISYFWKVKTPTLIMSDVGDWRVTTTQAYKLFHALKDNGVPVKFIAYPVPGHSPADPIRSRDVWRRWTAWLSLYLNAPDTPQQSAADPSPQH
jgi:dipeptidyl aminopeptidase/acylaminoacyl peptidase